MKKTVLLTLVLLAAVPAVSWAQSIPGVYVLCPKNKPENCVPAEQAFRAAFPHDQTGPYLLIRGDGGGYMAPNDRITMDFTWNHLGDDSILLMMNDSKKSKVKYQIQGGLLKNLSTRELYILSLRDEDWNKPNIPDSQAKGKKAKTKRSRSGAQK